MKKNILLIIIGIIIGSGLTGVIAYSYDAKSVGYVPKDNTWNIDNVESAINDLYSSRNSTLSFASNDYSEYVGNRKSDNIVSKELTKGRYLVLLVNTNCTQPNEKNRRINNEIESIPIYCNNCTINKTVAPRDISITTGTSYNSSAYLATNLNYGLFYVEIKDDTDTISYNSNDVTYSQQPSYIRMEVLKFN